MVRGEKVSYSTQITTPNWLQKWVWAGIKRSTLNDISHIRLTNIIALLVILVLALQMPLAMTYLDQEGITKLILVAVHILLLVLVPVFNHHHKATLATGLLIVLYSSYLVLSIIFVNHQVNIHYFFVLGCIISPFLFQPQQHLSGLLTMLLFASLFLVFSFKPAYFANPHFDHSQIITQANALFFLMASVMCSWHVRKNLINSRAKITDAQQRSENLLVNMIPIEIAEQLSESHKLVADHLEQVSILFADIADFSHIASHRSPQELVRLLNDVFTCFDQITSQYQLEKIKTIGDEYMAVSGAPKHNKEHAYLCCTCALEMQTTFQKLADTYRLDSGLRVGIASGEVIAGVIGKNRYSYDLWGETVNLASRMEAHGVKNQIQVSQTTYELTQDQFEFTPRGKITVKGIGEQQTWWLHGKKTS
jgi:guanylate cyclase